VNTFELIEKHGDGHEQIVFCRNQEAGLKAIIAIHNTALGPALGGTRMWNYKSEEEALIDVLRLSKGMTYKAAAAGLNLGGGKAVIIGDPKKDKSEIMFRAFGAYVNSLAGQYITAEDVGTTEKDMEYIFMETPFVTGIPKAFGGSGDPSPYTAHGVLMAIKASAKEKLGVDNLAGLRVAVQGLGNVGSHLVDFLHKEGAKVIVSDIDKDKIKTIVKRYGCAEAAPDDITSVECEIFAPCALGAIINDQSIPKLKCKIVAGGANNQLAEHRHGHALQELGILYAPDFVANAGGLMNVFVELEGYSSERAFDKTKQDYDSLTKIFKLAKEKGIPTHEAANQVSEVRLAKISSLRQHHQGRMARPFSTLKEMTLRR
jgi:leucine dehydrogenase